MDEAGLVAQRDERCWGGRLLAVVIDSRAHNAFDILDEGIYSLASLSRAKDRAAWLLKRPADELEVAEAFYSSHENQANLLSIEYSRLPWGSTLPYPGRVVVSSGSGVELVIGRGGYQRTGDKKCATVRPEAVLTLSLAGHDLYYRFGSTPSPRDLSVPLEQAAGVFHPVVEKAGWLMDLMETWRHVRFCAGDYLALLQAAAFGKGRYLPEEAFKDLKVRLAAAE